ncbi:endo-1,4-beta-xylanase [Ruminococcus flavefaciens]|uniref:endo-1,4-beta-xylanase n=1 Tax=Ruminococcus flavefaciens TaxID=1265 RepID=UPI00030F07A5|nr:endo-1,4-beta-xylanase [Ruminococcus flavefaciens]
MKVKRIVASLTAAGCLSGVVTVFPEVVQRTYAAQIVYNDFERNYEGWYNDGETVELTAQPAAGTGMSRGMKVSGRTSPEDGAASSKGLYLFGGDSYTYSVKVYSNTAEKFRLSLLTIDEETGKETTVELASKNVPAGEWTELKSTYTAPEGSYEFKVKLTNDSTEDFFFDDFLIKGNKAEFEAHAAPAGKGLKDEFADYFRVGNIFNGQTIRNSGIQGILLKDCNAIECENETKPWDTLVQSGSTDTNVKVSLNSCAAICDFCVKNGLGFRGHTLVWHSQTREWFFKENFNDNGAYVNASTMDKRMESYIKNMFAAFKTQYPDLDLFAYDVCNEVVYDGTANNGGARPTTGNDRSSWVQVYGGNSFVEKAFTYARKYAPSTCKLYYNDYNEFSGDKKRCIINTILKPLMEKGLIDGMGMQSHVSAASGQYDWGGTPSYLAAMDDYLSLGLDVQVTELDISTEGGKYSLQQQAEKYKAIFQHAVEANKSGKYKGNVTLVQVWGPNDNNSWVGTDKATGKSNAPLLYDGNNQPKAAYSSVTSIIPDSQWGVGLPYKGPGSSGFVPTPVEPPKVSSEGYWFHSTFEDSEDNWTGRGSSSVATSSTTKYAGSKSLYVTDRAASWNGAAISLDPSIFQNGEEYSFSVNACYLDGSEETQEFKLTLQYNDSSNDPHYDQVAIASAPKGEWVQLANTNFKIPADASDLQLYVETTDENVYGNFYIDEAIGAPAGTVIDGAGQPKVRKLVLGDVNFDECIDSLDMITARKGLIKGGFDDAMTQKAADVDQNKTFEVADLVLLQQYVLKKITEFPVNKPPVPEVDLTALASKFGNVTLAETWKKDNENNPIYTQRFGADPGWLVYDGRLYVYTTADEFAYKNGQMIENDYSSGYINCLSTADLVNWTDHGQIPVAKTRVNGTPIAKWANNAWAPDAAWKNIKGQDKFFLYFANNGSGIGVITADDPTFTKNVKDPLGHELISRNTPNSNVTWLFDPGVYYDPETDRAIMAYGGGVPKGQEALTKQGRIVELGDDMISIKGTPIDPGAPYLFEDSSMIKIGNTWYYSFCHNWDVPGGASSNGQSFSNADIGYMTSTDPLKGYTYQGVVFKNTGSQRLDNGGNNHHSIIEFKGNYYVLYHSRRLEMNMGVNGGRGLNYRSPCIDKATISNGRITCNGSQNGVSQLENLDPTQIIRATTMSNQSKGISVAGVGNSTLELKKGEWGKVSKVDFSNVSGTLTAKASSKNGAIIKVVAGSRTGDAITYIEVPAGGSMEEIITPMTNLPSGASDIYFIANGDVSFDSWSMS